MLQLLMTWAEDRATVGTDPSADPGAKTEWGGTMPPSAIRDWHQSGKSPEGLATPRLTPTRRRGLLGASAVTVSFTGSLAAVLVVCGCTPTHPFVNTSAVRLTLRSPGPGTDRPVTEGRLNHWLAQHLWVKAAWVQGCPQTDLLRTGDKQGPGHRFHEVPGTSTCPMQPHVPIDHFSHPSIPSRPPSRCDASPAPAACLAHTPAACAADAR
jgi:hypothetical protein